MRNKLTREQVDAATTDKARLELRDGGGLLLMVLASGKRTWFVRRTHQGKTVQRRIGDAANMTLVEARRAAADAARTLFEPDAAEHARADDPFRRELAELREQVASQQAAFTEMRGDIQALLSRLTEADRRELDNPARRWADWRRRLSASVALSAAR